jgi:uncharacterized protein
MAHLERALGEKNEFWRYLVVIVLLFFTMNIIGAIPLVLAIIVNAVSDPSTLDTASSNFADLSQFGIDPVPGFALMLFPFLVGSVLFVLIIKPFHGRSIFETINGTGSFRWSRFVAGAMVWLLLSVVYLLVLTNFDPENIRVNNLSTSLIPLVAVALLLIPFQSGLEEVVFRGYLMQGFYKIIPRKWFPLLVTSLVFGLMHGFNPEVKEFGFFTMMPHYILFGLLFGIVTILDDGAEVAMGGHIANNFFLSVMITHRSSALQTPAVFEQLEIDPWPEFFSLALMSILFILILGRIFKWKADTILR